MNISEALDVISKIDKAYAKRREAILYSYAHDKTITEIAAALGMKKQNVSAIINSKPIEPS